MSVFFILIITLSQSLIEISINCKFSSLSPAFHKNDINSLETWAGQDNDWRLYMPTCLEIPLLTAIFKLFLCLVGPLVLVLSFLLLALPLGKIFYT